MANLESQGTVLKIGDGNSPEVFTAVGEIKEIGGPSGSAPVIDVSNLSSTKREKIMGLPDEGQVSMSLNYDHNDAQQTALRTARTARTAKNFTIETSDSPSQTLSFTAYVLEFSLSFAVDEVVGLTVTLEITDAVTFA